MKNNIERFRVLIASRNRVKKLTMTLLAIEEAGFPMGQVCVIFDEVSRASEQAFIHLFGITAATTGRHSGSVAARNWGSSIWQLQEFNTYYMTDDVEVDESFFLQTMADFNKHFEDEDGVLGIAQEGEHHKTGLCIVGSKFAKRTFGEFPFNPSYYHFACQEILWAAEHLKKFHYSLVHKPVKHFHPAFAKYKDQMDQTHLDARMKKAEDHALMKERMQNKLIWGVTE